MNEKEEELDTMTNVANETNALQRLITGRVIEVVRPGNREFVCSVSVASTESFVFKAHVICISSNLLLMVPLNKRIPCCFIHTHNVLFDGVINRRLTALLDINISFVIWVGQMITVILMVN